MTTSIYDISALKHLIELTVLDLDGNKITDVNPLMNLTSLTELDLHDNAITDVSPLKDLTNLKVLDLSENHIFDFSPVDGLIENLMEYNFDNQTAPPPGLESGSVFNFADVNRDGVVDLIDLISIASHFHAPDLSALADMNIFPDVNRDGDVDIIDLLIVASELDNAIEAAPQLNNNFVTLSNLTVSNLSQWILSAKQLGTSDPKIQKGLTVLESLLELLSNQVVLPKRTVLLQNYPNPFNPETWIPFQLAKPANVTISIYSVDGKHIRKLKLGHLPAGVYQDRTRSAYWNGQNDLGELVPSGLFFYTLSADDFIATAKMIILK